MAHDLRSPHIFVDGPGSTASGDQVMDNFDAVWAAVDPAFAAYQKLERGGGVMNPSSGANTYMLNVGATAFANAVAQPPGTGGSAPMAFYLDPADYVVSGRTTKLRNRFQLMVNATASATNHTLGLYPVATFGGAAAAVPTVATVGTVIAGSTILLSSSVASTQQQGNSGDFTIPSAGYYVLAVNSGGTAVGSAIVFAAELQMRWV